MNNDLQNQKKTRRLLSMQLRILLNVFLMRQQILKIKSVEKHLNYLL